jgi:hypothetical protein
MRNTKTFQIRKKLNALVYELTVAQALEVFWLIGDFTYPGEFENFLQAHKADALTKAQELINFSPDFSLAKLTHDEQQALIGHFLDVNKAFFTGSNETPVSDNYGFEPLDLTGFEHFQNLSAVVNRLVRLKHVDVLNYPFSLLNAVIEELQKESEQANGE